MAVLLTDETRVVVQGITGREGGFHAGRNLAYGTAIVAGTRPGKGGTMALDGQVPVFDTVDHAVRETDANASLIFVPGAGAADAILEAEAAGCELIVCITDPVPVKEMTAVVSYLRGSDAVMIGPNCPGIISPGVGNMGIIADAICMPGSVGVVSRSGTLTYQLINELTIRGIGQSTCVGIGGDPVKGSDFIDILAQFEYDPATEAIVMIGEIGGEAEEQAAQFIAEEMTKPVVAYIAGFAAPPGKRMGHAGAIIQGSSGTAEAKAETLEACGVRVGRTPDEVGELVAQLMSS